MLRYPSSRVLYWFAAGALALYVAGLFYLNANSSSLYSADPVTDRAAGEYVTIELWLGSLHPTTWARGAEKGIALLFTGLALFGFSRAVRTWHAPSSSPAA